MNAVIEAAFTRYAYQQAGVSDIPEVVGPPDTYEDWLALFFPNHVRAGFAERHHQFWRWVWALESGVRPATVPVLLWPRGGAKALAVNTPIPTPDGWTTMGDLRPGDVVFDHLGQPTTVLATSGIEVKPCHRMTFADGATIVASGDHRWAVLDKDARASLDAAVADWASDTWPAKTVRPCEVETCSAGARKGTLCSAHAERRRRGSALADTPVIARSSRGSAMRSARVVTTDDLSQMTLRRGALGQQEHVIGIPLARPLATETAVLPIDPYLLGVWLGDGHSPAPIITVGAEDRENLLEMLEPITPMRLHARPFGVTSIGIPRFAERLRALGVFRNKHIPASYLRASISQRLDLLRGLLDTDGTPGAHGRSAEFTSTRKVLADGCAELARTLGYRAVVGAGRATLEGRDCGPVWKVRLAGVGPEVFGLRRKAETVTARAERALRWSGRMHYLSSVERVPDQSVQCITVAASSGMFLAGEAMIPTHNSTSVELACAAIGARGARRYVLYVSGKQPQADDHVGNVAALLESPRIGEYYPELGERKANKFGSSLGWRRNRIRTASGFTVDALGLDVAARGVKLEEQRPDLIVFDDVDDTADSQETVQKKIRAITQKILPAEAPEAGALFVQNIVHYESIAARLAGLASEEADFLADREVSGPYPAVVGLKTERIPGSIKHRVTGGVPTWAGQDLATCEAQINRWGIKAFRAEAQHERTPPEGQAFPEFDQSVHVVSPYPIPDKWPKARAIDYGYAAPYCCIWLARKPDGGLVAYREDYEARLTASQQAKRVAVLSGDETYVHSVGDPSMWATQREGKRFKSVADQYKDNGVTLKPASNDRVAGIERIHDMLDWADEKPPSLTIFSTCHNLIRTLPMLPRDPHDPEDVDTDAEDHAYDGLRYGAMALGSGRKFAQALAATQTGGHVTLRDKLAQRKRERQAAQQQAGWR